MHKKLSLLILPLTLVSLASCGSSGGGLDTTSPQALAAQSSANSLPINTAIVSEVNRYRASKGKKALSRSAVLDKLSSQHSSSMAKSSKMSHDGFGKRASVARAAKITPLVENVAVQPTSVSATDVVSKWSNSSHHKSNMLSGNNIVGVGTATANGQRYYTLMVGSQ